MRIPFLRPNLVPKEAYYHYLAEIDAAHWYSNFGRLNTRFEQQVLTGIFGFEGSVTTVNNATTGLMLAISLSKRPHGRYAVMPSFTFAATPLAALWCGLQPFFVDVREGDWCADESQISDAVRKLGDDVAVVVPYATFGTALDLDFYSLLHRDGIPVVIDAAASFGSYISDKHFGRGFPGFVVYSFHATKVFGIGEGGLVYSADWEAVSRLRQASNFGFSASRESGLAGLNGKMSEYAAAVALATLDTFFEKRWTRLQVHDWYTEEFKRHGLFEKGWVLHQARGEIAYQFIPSLCPEHSCNVSVVQHLAQREVEARMYFHPPCHQQPTFFHYPRTELLLTEKVSRRCVSLPLWEGMVAEDVAYVVRSLFELNSDYGSNDLRKCEANW
jgi:dTDP-4-amino-4,6-dideoxygalactose transaminase